MNEPPRVAIVGAGYAGLAAAVELADAGIGVDLFEASKTLGGRARGVIIDGQPLDNGAHLLVGAYSETLRLMQRVGSPADALKRMPLRLEIAGCFRLVAPKGWPAPLHLAWAILTAQGLGPSDKLAAISFMRKWQACGFRIASDQSVSELVAPQPERLRRFLWEPLCLAALNTPAHDASARIFLNVLRDSLASRRAASDLLLPATDLSSLFPEPASRWLTKRGAVIHRSTRIGTIRAELSEGREHYFLGKFGPYRQVIVAVAPQHAVALLGGLPGLTALREQLAALHWQPIVTCYLRYPVRFALPAPMIGSNSGFAQWLFDRHTLCGQPGVIAAVISGHGRHEELDAEALAMQIDADVRCIVPGLPAPEWHRIVTEKRATFACTPHLKRPRAETPLPGLILAGDYVEGDYPATLEGAVRSGIEAARMACQRTRTVADSQSPAS